MESFLIKALQLILSLSILIVLHELGHFIFACLAKVRVDKFYIFFNPQISLVRAKKINGKWQIKFFARNVPANERPKKDEDGETVKNSKGKPVMELIPLSELPDDDWRKHPETTEWGIGWLPLGGYCKISGMIDESMDTLQMKQEPQKWEYRSKSVWKRLPIITGGVIVNFLLAIVIYGFILYKWGDTFIPAKSVETGMAFSETARNLGGYQNNDIILSLDGKEMKIRSGMLGINTMMQFVDADTAVVLRSGKEVKLAMPKDFAKEVIASKETPFVFYSSAVIDSVYAEAKISGLQKGDRIVAINGKTVTSFLDIKNNIGKDNNIDRHILIEFYRDTTLASVSVLVSKDKTIGIGQNVNPKLEVVNKKYGFFNAQINGAVVAYNTLAAYISQFRFVFSKDGAKQLGGFGTLGNLFPSAWDWERFWGMTAFLSIILAFMNILPIPALDGGHVMFLLYEMITGKKPGDKFLERAQTIGMIILITLLIYANGNDVFRLFK